MRKTILALGWVAFAAAGSLLQMGCPSSSPSAPASSNNSPAAPVTHFALGAPASRTAGTSFNFSVALLDTNGEIVTNYTGTVHFTCSDGNATLPADSTLTNGIGTFTATLVTAGNQTISANDSVTTSLKGTSEAVVVNPAAATHFLVAAPVSVTAGAAFSVTVTARDVFNNTATGYTGTLHFSSSDSQATLPANSTLTNGTGIFSATLKTANVGETLTATDTVTSSISGTASITDSAAAATHFIVSAPASANAGVAFIITVTAFDQFNNIATGYTGTVHFTSSDGQATLPANSTLSNGTASFTATLKTSSTQTISAADTVTGSLSGTSGNIIVSPGTATHYLVQATTPATHGTSYLFTVTAQDQFGNTAATYTGTVHFTCSDGSAVLPADSTLTNGFGIFHITFNTTGHQTVTATDTGNSSITGTSGIVTVS